MTTNLAIGYDLELYAPLVETDAPLYENIMMGIGTKSSPLEKQGMMFHADGISAEMAPINPIVDGPDAAVQHLYRWKTSYEEMLMTPLEGRNWVDLDDLVGLDEFDTPWLWREVTTFGCSPDYVRGRRRIVPRRVKLSSVREIGIHLHLNLRPEFCDKRTRVEVEMGREPTNTQAVADIALGLDERLSDLRVPAEIHPEHRWYRVPGLYRPTAYGLEYRSFGAAIVEHPHSLSEFFGRAWDFMAEHMTGGIRL